MSATNRTEELLDYEQDVRIDPNGLDVHWLEQPELMRKYAKHMALMEKMRDEAKERLEAGKARIEKSIRSDPEKYGLLKPTEAAIQSTIILQPEYQELSQQYIDAKYEHSIAVGAVKAIEQKKSALESLVRLQGQGYFAGPKAPRDLDIEYREHLERLEKKKAASHVQMRRTRKGS